ncbi:MAG: hypothetical protein AB7S56_09725 [Halothiobacillaceae bacterium]
MKSVEFHGASGNDYTLDARLAQGGQGTIYKVTSRSDGKAYAVKWYHARLASQEQRKQLEMLAQRGAPRVEVDGIQFIWPLEMVTLPDNSSFGYVMPLYDSDRYVHLNRVINGKRKQPRNDVLCRLSYLIGIALEAVHHAGLAYCDINLGNIQFDFDAGQLIVCDNDNVVVNNAEAGVMGVPEFMAPEVALGKDKPNAQSDLYSLAILLYQLWIWEHPMEGRLTAQVRCWDQPAKRKFYADEPIFVHHPTDQRNSAVGDAMLAYSVKRWEMLCPAALKKAFLQTFTEGIHQSNKRTRLADWRHLFMEMEANAVRCTSCSAVNLVDVDAPKRNCFHCGALLNFRQLISVQFPGGHSKLVVHADALLRRHHLDMGSGLAHANDIVGKVENHPKQAGAHILRNLTDEPWFYDQDDKKYRVEPGQARPLVPGGSITLGTAKLKIEAL